MDTREAQSTSGIAPGTATMGPGLSGAEFLSGDILTRHWEAAPGNSPTAAGKRKSKPKPRKPSKPGRKPPKPKPTKRGPGCITTSLDDTCATHAGCDGC